MGKRGPMPKSGEMKEKTKPNLTVIGGSTALSANPPKPPTGMLKQTRDKWHTFWESDVATMVQPNDLPTVERLFRNYDLHERAIRQFRKEMLVEGSKNQVRINPLGDYAQKLEQTILRLENELGNTPMARQRLGYAAAEKNLSLQQLNQMISSEEDHDPRILEQND